MISVTCFYPVPNRDGAWFEQLEEVLVEADTPDVVDLDAAVGGDPGQLEIHCSVEADDLLSAARLAVGVAGGALRDAGLPDWRLVAIEAELEEVEVLVG